MQSESSAWNIQTVVVLSSLIHAVMIAVGEWQDRNTHSGYSDIDYFVFSDAARHVYNGGSAFDRHTYRYSPLLAWLLVPNEFIVSWFGKVLFSIAGVVSGILIYKLTGRKLVYASMWLFSPLTINISTRGSCDSLLILFVLATFYYMRQGHLKTAAIWYGLAVHFRIFPIFFCIPIMFHLRNFRKILVFGMISASVAFGLVGLFYLKDGYRFLYEAYLYHFVRKDHRHNISIFYYAIYLASSVEKGYLTQLLTFAGFVPQILALLFVGIRFGRGSFMFAIFLQTVIFVAFNKVITAQYFLWYFGLLPVVLYIVLEEGVTQSKRVMSRTITQVVVALILWGISEVAWLHQSARLENFSQNSYIGLLTTSIALFASQIILCVVFIRAFVNSRNIVEPKQQTNEKQPSSNDARRSARLRTKS
jgi:GPI mannosyltransferase 1 subunit M